MNSRRVTMFYETNENNHGLPFNPFKSCVIPRPIGWITTIDSQGQDNLAPYSYFNILCDVPPMVMFSTTTNHHDGGIKDTLKNVEETKFAGFEGMLDCSNLPEGSYTLILLQENEGVWSMSTTTNVLELI